MRPPACESARDHVRRARQIPSSTSTTPLQGRFAGLREGCVSRRLARLKRQSSSTAPAYPASNARNRERGGAGEEEREGTSGAVQ